MGSFRKTCAGWAAVLFLAGCAFTNPDNTPLLRATERALNLEEHRTVRLLMMPVALPIGLLDVFVAHPIQVIDDAYEDTANVLWREPTGGTATRSYTFVPRAVFTPVVYLGSFLGRSAFDVPAVDEVGEKGGPAPEGDAEEAVRGRQRLLELEREIEAARRRLDRAQRALQERIDERDALRATLDAPER